jgi:hypothetical protein
MYSIPDRPFVASDPAVAMSVERWLDRQGYAIAYGHQSARAERGDLLLVAKAAEQGAQAVVAEAA